MSICTESTRGPRRPVLQVVVAPIVFVGQRVNLQEKYDYPLKDAGTLIGANDLWIACHALAEGATLVTHNTREFQRVEGLTVEDWVASA